MSEACFGEFARYEANAWVTELVTDKMKTRDAYASKNTKKNTVVLTKEGQKKKIIEEIALH